MVLGLWVALVPFLGFPGSWRTALLALSGLLIAAVGFELRRELVAKGLWSLLRRTGESYVEHDGKNETANRDTNGKDKEAGA